LGDLTSGSKLFPEVVSLSFLGIDVLDEFFKQVLKITPKGAIRSVQLI
jgi:hypothetical protein